MRLPKEMIKHIADAIAENLESKGLAEYEVPGSEIAGKIAEVITANMLEEERLNRDAEKMLAAHEAEIAAGQMDYRKMLDLAKKKLAKERGFVL
jgi:hypothetical protein